MNKNRIAILLAIILSLLVLTPVFAQGQQPPFPPLPLQHEYSSDTLHWLSPAQAQEINRVAGKLDSDGLAVIFVVTLDDCGPDSAQYKTDLFRAWKIGHAASNDGLLILVCWYGGDKSRRNLAQETGTGLESTVTDIQTSRMAQQYFVPAFQGDPDPVASGRAGQALVDLVNAYDALLRGKSFPTGQPAPSPAGSEPLPVASQGTAIAFLVIMAAIVLFIIEFFVRAFIKNVDLKNTRTRVLILIVALYLIGTYVLAYYNFLGAMIAGGILIVISSFAFYRKFGVRDRNRRRSRSSFHDDSRRSSGGGGTSEGGGSTTKF